MSRKLMIWLCSLFLFCQLPLYAEGPQSITVKVNDQAIVFDQPPEIINGSVMVPIRKVFEKMNIVVGWHEPTKTVFLNQELRMLKLTVGNDTANYNGRSVKFVQAPVIKNGRMLVPLRSISEAFQAQVEWDDIRRIVYINIPEIDEEERYPDYETNLNIHSVQVAAGDDYTLVLDREGQVWAWGNSFGGHIAFPARNTAIPIKVEGLPKIHQITTVPHTPYAITNQGEVWTWGSANWGPGPIIVKKMANFPPIAKIHGNIALAKDGTVWTWKGEVVGPLNKDDISPVKISDLTNVIDISVGSEHVLVLKKDGTVWSWGNNRLGQLGIGTFGTREERIDTPVQVKGLENITAITAGALHNAVLKKDGTVWTWGWNEYGQLGNGTYGEDNAAAIAAKVEGLQRVRTITVNTWGTFAITENNQLYSWGGDGLVEDENDVGNAAIPSPVKDMSDVLTISAGGAHTGTQIMVTKLDGSVWAWGNNYFGTLGMGITGEHINTPTKVLFIASNTPQAINGTD